MFLEITLSEEWKKMMQKFNFNEEVWMSFIHDRGHSEKGSSVKWKKKYKWFYQLFLNYSFKLNKNGNYNAFYSCSSPEKIFDFFHFKIQIVQQLLEMMLSLSSFALKSIWCLYCIRVVPPTQITFCKICTN